MEFQKICIEKRVIFAKVVKTGENLDRQIKKDTWRRSTYFREVMLRKEIGEQFGKTPEGRSPKPITTVDCGNGRDH